METEHKSGCLICGAALVYFEAERSLVCYYCGSAHVTQASCLHGHYVCDRCHEGSANDLIERYCAHTTETDPLAVAIRLMKSPTLKMHGPEHHFLVPAALLAAVYNLQGDPERKTVALRQARKRAENVLGGFCGFYGACGAGIGTGIFVSVFTGATPLSKDEWRLGNQITATCLASIAERGGPRCCKRDTFTALEAACHFAGDHLAISIPHQPVRCEFSALNHECLLEACGYHP